MTAHRTAKDVLYELVARVAKALGSPKRLEIIELLSQSPKAVELLAQEANISMKLASAHLKTLRAARLVDAERQGKRIVYRLASDEIARFWVTLRLLAEDRLLELQHAVRHLRATTQEWESSDRNELLRKAKKGEVVVIDVRPTSEYAASHLPFARSIPLAELRSRLAELPKRKPIVAYCRGPFCFLAVDAVKRLRAKGFAAHVLRDGVAEWSASENRTFKTAGVARVSPRSSNSNERKSEKNL